MVQATKGIVDAAVTVVSTIVTKRMLRCVQMKNELKSLRAFSVEVVLCDNLHKTRFVTFAKDAEAAEFFVKDYLQHYITDDFVVHGVFSSKIKEGMVLVND